MALVLRIQLDFPEAIAKTDGAKKKIVELIFSIA